MIFSSSLILQYTLKGFPIGSLCVLDSIPRDLTLEKKQALMALSRQVISQLELRINLANLKENINHRQQAEKNLRRTNQELNQVIDKLRQTQIQLIQTEKMSSLGQMVHASSGLTSRKQCISRRLC